MDLLSLHLQEIEVPQGRDDLAPRYRARFIELTGRADSIPVTRGATLSEITPPQKWQRGLVELTGYVDRIRDSKITIQVEDRKIEVVGANFDRWDGPAEGNQVQVVGVPLWSEHERQSESDSEKRLKLTLMIPTAGHLQLASVPLRVSRTWLAGVVGAFTCLLLGGVFWNHSLRRQVDLRTQQLKDSNRHLATSFEASREAIVLSDKDGRVVRINTNFERFFGFRPSEGSALTECLDQLSDVFESPDDFIQFCSTAEWGDVQREIELTMNKRSIQAFRNDVRDEFGRSVGQLWAFYDCTDQRRLEHELFQARKMEAIGQLSGGLAHDLNNLLTVISSNAEILKLSSEQAGVETKQFADPIDIAVSRAAGLTRQMLDFARDSQLDICPVDINSIVKEVYHLARGTIDANVDLSLSMHPDPLVVRADSGRIVQVLLNLCINARDAIEGDHGTIRLRTRLNGGDAENQTACFEVEDDGCGMTDDVRQRVFDPFFTTKQRQAGTGLGLSTAFGIVKQLGGHIECETAVSEGTVFRVFLPVADRDEQVDKVRETQTMPVPEKSGLRLLLVDDEELLRQSGAAALESLDHDVMTAVDGQDAIEIIEQSEPFDAVLLDLTMPRMNGHEACSIIRERWPELSVIICSGYSTTRLDESLEGVSFLSKPFRLNELKDTLRDVSSAMT